MKTYAVATALLLALAAAAPASAIEVLDNQQAAKEQVARLPDMMALHTATMLTSAQSSELPEPEVFAMMLLGLVLIGYRARRDSGEKFQ